jgi:hypothetical protein
MEGENQMVNDQVRRNDESGGLVSLLVAMIELGDATAKFAINQIQNAVDLVMDPGRAMDRTRRSLNNFSVAMYRSARNEGDRHEIATEKDLTGQHHVASQHESAGNEDSVEQHNHGKQNGSSSLHPEHQKHSVTQRAEEGSRRK